MQAVSLSLERKKLAGADVLRVNFLFDLVGRGQIDSVDFDIDSHADIAKGRQSGRKAR